MLNQTHENMSLKNTSTTSDFLNWNDMMLLIHRLYRDEKYRMSLLIGAGCFFGLRISDLLSLTWEMILDKETFVIYEKKTGKRREIKINVHFRNHIKECFTSLNIVEKNEKCFLSAKKKVYSTQRINVLLKEIKVDYKIKIENFSTHSLRKTFGRRVVDGAGINSEFALIKLSELFNHTSVMTTRRYLGLRAEEMLETYDLLEY